MIDRASFISTAIQGASYDDESEELVVTFRNGESYSYEGVPLKVWQAFKDAPSAGQFYFSQIKGSF